MAAEKGGILEGVKTLVYAVAIALFVRTFLYEPFNIPSGSMKPTLLVGDYLFVSKFSYGYSRYSLPFSPDLFQGRIWGAMPERGDVAVFKQPTDNSTDFIKRIVGLPGDKVQVKSGRLLINGEPVKAEQVSDFIDDERGAFNRLPQYKESFDNGKEHFFLDITPFGHLDNTGVYEVPPDHVFAMGDNRDNSQDSRTPDVGFIPVENLVGRADLLLFSVNGTASWYEVWKWPWAIRYDRLFKPIH